MAEQEHVSGEDNRGRWGAVNGSVDLQGIQIALLLGFEHIWAPSPDPEDSIGRFSSQLQGICTSTWPCSVLAE